MDEKDLLDAFHRWLACRILLQAFRDLRNPTPQSQDMGLRQQWGNGHRMEAAMFLGSPDAMKWARRAGCQTDPAQVVKEF